MMPDCRHPPPVRPNKIETKTPPTEKDPPTMKRLALITTLMLTAAAAHAQGGPQYNVHSGQYEIALPGASPQYNVHSGHYEMAGRGAAPQYNVHSGQYEMAVPGATPQYNV